MIVDIPDTTPDYRNIIKKRPDTEKLLQNTTEADRLNWRQNCLPSGEAGRANECTN